MKERLNRIRQPLAVTSKAASVRNTLLIAVFGIAMGAFAKWLDCLSAGSDIWWRRLIDKYDLGNVFSSFPVWLLIALAISVYSYTPLKAAINTFSFFAGMCLAYHIYTSVICGFDIQNYMLIWYGLTLASPIIAVICWYGKGPTIVSVVIDAVIFAFMLNSCFAIGWIYFDFISAVNTLIFIGAFLVLYRTPKQILCGTAAGAVLAYFMARFIHFGFI